MHRDILPDLKSHGKVLVRDIECVCLYHKYCIRWDTPTLVCFKLWKTCPMAKGILNGESPWAWRIPPALNSNWWIENVDEVSLREVSAYAAPRLREMTVKWLKRMEELRVPYVTTRDEISW